MTRRSRPVRDREKGRPTPGVAPGPAALSDARASAVERARGVFLRAGYTSAGIRELGVDPGLGVRRPDIPVLLRVLGESEPLTSLVRLFLLVQEVDGAELQRRLGDDLQVLMEAGLIEERDGLVRAGVQLVPWRDFLIPHDPDPEGDLWPNHVSGPTPAAETLAHLIVRGDVQQALDLGTGSGLLALLLSRQAYSVVATDINPVALRYAALAARLNNVPSIDVSAGGLFEPVADQRFGRIMSNPPFVIGPDSSMLFRHSDLPGDQMSREVVEGAAAHLEDDGIASILCNWIVPRGLTWLDAIRPWVDGSGCDAVVLLHGVEDPLSYTVRWNGRAQYVARETFGGLLERWVAHADKSGIEAIASGAVVLRRRTGSNWVHGLQLDGEAHGAGGPHLLTLFMAADYLATRSAEPDVLDTVFRLAGPHRLEQTLIGRGAEYVVEPARLVLEDNLGTSVSVEPDLIPVALALDGTQTLRQVIDAVSAGGTDASALTQGAVALVETMVERGYLRVDATP